MKNFLMRIALLLLPSTALAQFSTVSCTHGETGTCRQATTCSQANVQAAVTASAAGTTGYVSPTSFGGDGVYIPAGSCTWTSPVSWSNENLNVIGGIGGTTTITHTTSDAFDVSATNSGATAAAFRISNLTMSGPSGMSGHFITINGGAPPNSGWAGYFRIDHITYNYVGSGDTFVEYGPIFGVYDHLNGVTANKNHWLFSMFYNGEYPGSSTLLMGQGIATGFAAGFGTQQFVFVEDSTIECNSSYGSAALSDSSDGVQRFVFRHSTVTGSCFHYAHWTRDGEWDGGVMEFYNNIYNCSDSSCAGSGGYPGRFDAGTTLAHDSQIINYPVASFQIDEARGCGAETGGDAGAAPNANFDRSDGDASAPGWPTAGQVGEGCPAGGCTIHTMSSIPSILWNNGTQATCPTGGSCTNSITFNVDGPPGGGTCTRTMANYLKSTAHTSSGGLNGAIDYGSFSSQPSSVGIYTGIASYIPYTYPYPTTVSGCSLNFSPAAGTYSGTQNVTISQSGCPSGSTIYYRTDGLPATVIDMAYSSPVAVASSQTLTAIAVLNPSISDQPQTTSTHWKYNGLPVTTFPCGVTTTNSGGVAGTISDFCAAYGSPATWSITTTDSTSYDISGLPINTPTVSTDTAITRMSFREVYQDTSNCTQSSANFYKCVDVAEIDGENFFQGAGDSTGYLKQASTRCSTNEPGSSGNSGFMDGDASSGSEKWDIACDISKAADLTVNVHWTNGDTSCSGGVPCMVFDSIYRKEGSGATNVYNFPAVCNLSDTLCPNYPMNHPAYSNFMLGVQNQVYARKVSVAGTSPLTATRNVSFIRVGVDEGNEATGSAAYTIGSSGPPPPVSIIVLQ